jgi:hypothetical protein
MKITKRTLSLAAVLCSCLGASADTILIDSFTDGSNWTLQNTSGTASYNYITNAPDILGFSRQARTRSASSGYSGPSVFVMNTTAGTLTSYGGDSSDRELQYGIAIGSSTFTGAGTVAPVQLNQQFNLQTDKVTFDIVSVPTASQMGVKLFSGDGSTYTANLAISSIGTYSIALTNFSGLTQVKANDIDGIRFSPICGAGSPAQGLVVGELRFTVTPVPEPSTCVLAATALAGCVLLRRRSRG